MMTTMLGLTILTLIAIFFVIQRLRPSTEKSSSTDLKTTNDEHSSSLEDDSDEPASALALSSKKCYITLVQHDDEDEEDNYLSEKPSICKPRTNLNGNNDGFNATSRYPTSSTNIICQSDEQHQAV